jgi:hypothetical protein
VLGSDKDTVEQETKREAKQYDNKSFERGSEIESYGNIDLPVQEKVSEYDTYKLEQKTKKEAKQHTNEFLEAHLHNVSLQV